MMASKSGRTSKWTSNWKGAGLALLLSAALFPALAAQTDRHDARAERLRDADHYELRTNEPASLQAWEARKAQLKEKVLLAAGLWPTPDRNPLGAKIFEEKQGEGFSVSKVYFESLPGFFVTGNLYKPSGKSGPFPAVLMPHGHWKYGRLTNGVDGSIPGRAIDFARQGFVVFSVDMVGYNDSFQLPHDSNKSTAQLKADQPEPYEQRVFKANFEFPKAKLYGFSLGGLQLWNSIRSMDFLSELPEVDPQRIGVTGASGGASQTILLMAVDDRVQVAAPVNIIGAAKHPGCECENIPNLWIDTSTIELAATFAPKPLLLMSATEDPWTNSTPTRELPIIRKYFALYGQESMVKNVHIEAGHNYNAATRSAVYEWFVAHLKAAGPLITSPVPVSPDVAALGDLRVFPQKLLPAHAKTGWQVIDQWIEDSEQQFEKEFLASREKWNASRSSLREALRLALSVDVPKSSDLTYQAEVEELRGDVVYSLETIGRKGADDWLGLESAVKAEDPVGAVLLVYPDTGADLVQSDGTLPFPWAKDLLDRGLQLYHVKGYASGTYYIPPRTFDSFSWSDAYNRGNELNAIQDIVTAMCSVEQTYPDSPLSIIGMGDKGLLTAFAAAVYGKASSSFIDLNRTDPGYDGELMQVFPVGGIRRIGDIRTAVLLLLDHPVTLFSPGPTFASEWYRDQARKLEKTAHLEITQGVERVNFSTAGGK